jgi:hypothetical protein
MESDSKRKKNKKKISGRVSNSGDIFQSFRVRRSIPFDYELDRVLLDYGFNFLLPFGIFLWVIFFIVSSI